MMKLPSIACAEEMLRQGEAMHPGLWIEHCRSTGVNARLIAERCDGLDPDAAYVMGLLHDIGRRYGYSYMKHTLDGYRFLMDQRYDDAAMICLTHSFQAPRIHSFMGEVDVPPEDYAMLKDCIENRPFTEYDKLIQLCDAVSIGGGGVLIEKRLMDVGFRYGVNDDVIIKWKATFDLKAHFDELAGENIYRLLPNIVENTFAW